MRGPALDTVATRLTRDQIIRQVIQGSGNMPAYGKNLRPAEVTCAGRIHANAPAFVSARGEGFYAAGAVRCANECSSQPALGIQMDPIAAAVLASWTLDLKTVCLVLAVGILYVRGWLRVHSELPRKYTIGKLAAFASGLLVLLLALASPVDAFGQMLLSAHMIQHLLLIMVAPPLLLRDNRCCRCCVVCRDGSLRTRSGHFLVAGNCDKSAERWCIQ